MSAFELPDRIFNEIIRLSRQYYREAEKCREANAFLAGCIMIGSALEAMLLAFANCYPEEASNSTAVPRKRNGVVKPLIEWSLADLLRVAKEQYWLPSGLSPNKDWDDAKAHIGDYGEIIRQIRNFVHPARYALDMSREKITKRYLEAVFESIEVAHEHLMHKLNESIWEAIEKEETNTV